MGGRQRDQSEVMIGVSPGLLFGKTCDWSGKSQEPDWHAHSQWGKISQIFLCKYKSAFNFKEEPTVHNPQLQMFRLKRKDIGTTASCDETLLCKSGRFFSSLKVPPTI